MSKKSLWLVEDLLLLGAFSNWRHNDRPWTVTPFPRLALRRPLRAVHFPIMKENHNELNRINVQSAYLQFRSHFITSFVVTLLSAKKRYHLKRNVKAGNRQHDFSFFIIIIQIHTRQQLVVSFFKFCLAYSCSSSAPVGVHFSSFLGFLPTQLARLKRNSTKRVDEGRKTPPGG